MSSSHKRFPCRAIAEIRWAHTMKLRESRRLSLPESSLFEVSIRRLCLRLSLRAGSDDILHCRVSAACPLQKAVVFEEVSILIPPEASRAARRYKESLLVQRHTTWLARASLLEIKLSEGSRCQHSSRIPRSWLKPVGASQSHRVAARVLLASAFVLSPLPTSPAMQLLTLSPCEARKHQRQQNDRQMSKGSIVLKSLFALGRRCFFASRSLLD